MTAAGACAARDWRRVVVGRREGEEEVAKVVAAGEEGRAELEERVEGRWREGRDVGGESGTG